LKVEAGGFISRGYDRSQRAYLLEGGLGAGPAFKGKIEASEDSPLVNACFVFKDWSGDWAAVKIDGRPAVEGRDFRFGVVRGLESDEGILWIVSESTHPVELEVEPLGSSRHFPFKEYPAAYKFIETEGEKAMKVFIDL